MNAGLRNTARGPLAPQPERLESSPQTLDEKNITEIHAWIGDSDPIVATPDQYAVAASKSEFLT